MPASLLYFWYSRSMVRLHVLALSTSFTAFLSCLLWTSGSSAVMSTRMSGSSSLAFRVSSRLAASACLAFASFLASASAFARALSCSLAASSAATMASVSTFWNVPSSGTSQSSESDDITAQPTLACLQL